MIVFTYTDANKRTIEVLTTDKKEYVIVEREDGSDGTYIECDDFAEAVDMFNSAVLGSNNTILYKLGEDKYREACTKDSLKLACF